MDNNKNKPSKIGDIWEIKPMRRTPDDECHAYVEHKYKYDGWLSLTIAVCINGDVVGTDDDRRLIFERASLTHSCSACGFPFICAINPNTGEWIAFPQLCEPIDGINSSYAGNGLMEDCLKGVIGEKFGFDGEKELYCERLP